LEHPTATSTPVLATATPTPESLVEPYKFPIGLFDCPDCGVLRDYTEYYGDDGTLIVYMQGVPELKGQWYVEGDIFHTGDSWCGDYSYIPATYRWQFDGEYLTFDEIEDNCPDRVSSLVFKAWRLIETIPIGKYSHLDDKYILEIGEENSFTFIENGSVAAVGTYSINGNEFTWETDSYCGNDEKATYVWHYEDNMLSFQLIDKDNCGDRKTVIDGLTYYKEEEKEENVTLPLGTYSANNGDKVLEIRDESSFTFSKKDGSYNSSGTFSIDGNEITWETDSYCEQNDSGKATYKLIVQSNVLIFRVVGRDSCLDRSVFLTAPFTMNTDN
jgi:hypothetical protein